MRVLITGARGFVGKHLQSMLAKERPDCTVLTPSFDVTDRQAVFDAVEAVQPQICFHLAAVSSIGQARSEPDLAWRVNLGGVLNVADALKSAAPEALLVFTSTSEAYGDSFRGGAPLDETAALAPGNTYSATKSAADLALGALANDGLRVVRMRPFNHTGAGQTDSFVVPAFARQIARIEAGRQEPLISVGNLSAERDFLDVRDICAAYASCLTHGATLPKGAILNLCSGQTRSIRSILDDLLRLSGVAAKVEIAADKLRPVDLPRAAGSSARAAELLGWRPRIAWDDTLRSVLDDWRRRVRDDA
ncbi:GDP-mannose 4,6-dehydratase [Acetobacter sacchari]|uniref:GDP-mannose 4,6-dehydratase n=1 Tax=Acetobacter sacchari TaxID=2661687 RepID=A0ABS3LY77_9PROT|nr:GDP-mannose 4,6-dehydratase [Acetobacter sacchari]MBO1360865.1 GDP-mannose 4,6-dehydratase [Acetobacter sacchari]